jgi:hypothetical protein
MAGAASARHSAQARRTGPIGQAASGRSVIFLDDVSRRHAKVIRAGLSIS